MAKKAISKHSRAARRLEVSEPEAKALETLPRTDKTDFTASLIRTANKNEKLLEAKINKRSQRGKKKANGRVGKADINDQSLTTDKLTRALNIHSRLDGKREKSIHRAKYVQAARKAGWDSTNASIKKELTTLRETKPTSVTDDSVEHPSTEDVMDDDTVEPFDSAVTIDETPETSKTATPVNAFAALEDEVEA